MKIIWIDVETTGLDFKEDRIIELAALYEDTKLNHAEHGEKAKSLFHKFCKPFDKPPEKWGDKIPGMGDKTISEATGITWEKLEKEGLSDGDLYREFHGFIADKIESFNKDDKAIFAAYNAKFDNNMIRALWNRNEDKYFGSYFLSANLDILSTVALAISREVMPPLVRHSLDVVCAHFDIQLNAHSAKDDIIASRKVQLELEKKLGVK